MARAIKRLYEIKGIDGQGNRGDLTSATVAEVAKETGKSEKTVQRLRTLADLIPELSAMLDAKTITQKVAYHERDHHHIDPHLRPGAHCSG